MSVEFLLRILGMLGFGIGGGFWGYRVAQIGPSDSAEATVTIITFALVCF